MPRKMGRPTKLGQFVKVPTPENPERRIKIGEYVCELMEANGHRVTLCADMAGIDRNTIKAWIKKGLEAESKDDKGHLLTPEDQKHLDFLIGTRAAHARWIHNRREALASLASGGLTVSEVIQEVDPTQEVLRPDGSRGPKVIKTRTKTSRMLPSESALRFELERLALDEDGQRIFAPRVEVTGADGGPVLTDDKDARADALARELEAFQRGAETQREVDGEKAEP